MRLQLAGPEHGLLSPEAYNQFFEALRRELDFGPGNSDVRCLALLL